MLYTVIFLTVPNMLPSPCHHPPQKTGGSVIAMVQHGPGEPVSLEPEQQPLKTANSVTTDPQPLSPVLSSMR